MYVEDPKKTLARNLNRLIKRYKRQTGISYSEFCRRTGIPRSVLHETKAGATWPTAETLRKICSQMEIPVEVLFRR